MYSPDVFSTPGNTPHASPPFGLKTTISLCTTRGLCPTPETQFLSLIFPFSWKITVVICRPVGGEGINPSPGLGKPHTVVHRRRDDKHSCRRYPCNIANMKKSLGEKLSLRCGSRLKWGPKALGVSKIGRDRPRQAARVRGHVGSTRTQRLVEAVPRTEAKADTEKAALARDPGGVRFRFCGCCVLFPHSGSTTVRVLPACAGKIWLEFGGVAMFCVDFHTTKHSCESVRIYAVVTGREGTVPVHGRSRRRVEGDTGVDAGADNHQPLGPFAAGDHRG